MVLQLIDDIINSLNHKSYFSALALALTLPDICGGAEYPNKSVTERYIAWYDVYVGPYMKEGRDNMTPWLSGELVYNLRNTFLHQGSPNINSKKIKEEQNYIDRFALLLGDDDSIWDMTLDINVGNGKKKYNVIAVNVIYLCKTICHCAKQHYQCNQEKYSFDYTTIPI